MLEDSFFCRYCDDFLFLHSLPLLPPPCFPFKFEMELGECELAAEYSFHSVRYSTDKSVAATVHCTRLNLC